MPIRRSYKKCGGDIKNNEAIENESNIRDDEKMADGKYSSSHQAEG